MRGLGGCEVGVWVAFAGAGAFALGVLSAVLGGVMEDCEVEEVLVSREIGRTNKYCHGVH